MNTMHKLSAAILLAMAGSSALAANDSELDALRARIDALEKQASQNSAAIVSTQNEIKTAYKEAPLLVRRTINDAASAAARIDNATYGDDLSGFFKLPNTQSVMRIGGYLKLDAIYDLDPTGDPDQFIVSALPATGADNQFHMHAKQTRINFEIRRPTNDTLGPLRILIENDFFGSGGSTNYRLRHAFAQVNNILGGYTYSTFMDADSLPNTLDFAGPGGAVFLFTPQLRFSKALSEGSNIAFAIERPASEIDYAGGGTVTGDASTPMPDFVGRVRWESTGGHVQLGAVLRDVAYDDGAGNDDSVMGGGASITGVVKVVGSDSVQFGFTGGQGLGHYFSDLNGGSQDAGFDANGELEALKSVGGYVAYQHYWTEQWNSSLVYGNLQVDNSAGQAADALHKDQYASLNLLWSPANTRLTMGMEVLHGTLELKDGSDRDATRIQLSAQLDLMR
ncbi:MAG: DcaP family trimeric outer membrane transporter [Pedobacter sp.]|nr:DcaP family trimeric outer membrane transporter [Pedobacter sp.]